MFCVVTVESSAFRMPLELLPISKSDAEAITKLTYAAFQDDPQSKILYDVPVSPATVASTLASNLETWDSDPTRRRMQIKDTDTGDMISASIWYILPQRYGDDYKKLPDYKWPEGWHAEEAKKVFTNLFVARNRIMGAKPYICMLFPYFSRSVTARFILHHNPYHSAKPHLSDLQSLVTSPAHRRRGAASLLLDWGMKQSQALNLPIFLVATPSGLPIYQKHKFQTVEELPVTGTPNRVHACMILPAPFPEHPHNLIHSSLVPQPFPHLSATTPSNSFHSPQASPYNITISPVTSPSDFPRLVEVEVLAFATTPMVTLLFPPSYPLTTPTGEYTAWIQSRAKDHIDELGTEPSNHYLKAVDANGTIIGWTKWHFFDDLTREHKPFPSNLPPGVNQPLMDAVFARGKELRETKMKGKQYGYVAQLIVLPEWQRKGVGKMLLEVGLQVVDQRGWECWIDASAAGMGLYKKLGWEVLQVYETDLGPFGGEAGYIDSTYAMLRKAKVESEI